MKPAIEVKNLSKSYIINHKNKASYSTLKDDLANIFRKPLGKGSESTEEQFWALKNISFEVPQGEIFGVVGQNGSGKSTLLKILSQIVQPTEGSITMRGKVASLLEVGTGFHPELTGRENIFFNGSMLGMSRQEISSQFDKIVEFSEVERFIDTPVKFYSSGMYVRLAFSVAAHLNPDILILDEVLAVGDASFQKKSLQKIISTMREGKTVLFVSHSMDSVRQLCSRGILLDQGNIMYSGDVDGLIEKYTLENEHKVLSQQQDAKDNSWHNKGQVDDEHFCPDHVYITDEKGKRITGTLSTTEDYWIHIEGTVLKANPKLNIGYSIWGDEGRNLLYQTFTTDGAKSSWPDLKPGKVHVMGKLPRLTLNAGLYKLKAVASIYGEHWILDPDSSQAKFSINVRLGENESPYWKHTRGGLFAPSIEWRTSK